MKRVYTTMIILFTIYASTPGIAKTPLNPTTQRNILLAYQAPHPCNHSYIAPASAPLPDTYQIFPYINVIYPNAILIGIILSQKPRWSISIILQILEHIENKHLQIPKHVPDIGITITTYYTLFAPLQASFNMFDLPPQSALLSKPAHSKIITIPDIVCSTCQFPFLTLHNRIPPH